MDWREQYRLWHQGRVPVAFASWAFLNADAEERIRRDFRALTQDDWNAGDQAWLIDMVAPFGGMDEAVVDLKQKVFPDRTLKALRPAPDGNGNAVVEW